MKHGEFKYIGKRVPRVDGPERTTGQLKYMTDLQFPNMVWGKVLRAKYPHAKIVSIDTKEAEALEGVVAVLTYKDIPGFNGFGIVDPDQPVLCEDVVRTTSDAVALVAAETEEIAEEALTLIKVEYKQLEVVSDPEYAMTESAPKLHPSGNTYSHVKIKNGDVEKAFSEADFILENTFISPRQMHAFIETEGGWSMVEKDGSLTIYCPGQYAYRDRLQVARALALNPDRIRIVSSPLGGAFGGKDEITVQIYLALLALHTNGRPVKLHLKREESVQAGIKRHPFKVEVKTAVKNDGTIIGHKVRAVADTGAYASLGGAVIALAIEHACGPYKIPNIDLEGFCVYTNNGVSGAFRGFGVNQVCVGIETHLDMIAEKLNISPIELRKIHAYREGEVSSLGHLVKSSVGTHQTLEAAENCDLWRYKEKYKSETSEPWKKRGIGIATSFHGVGMGIGVPDYGAATIELLPDGRFLVGVGCEEIGGGNGTVYALIAAECLRSDLSNIAVIQGDTSKTIDGGTVTASRSTYSGGRAVATAAPFMIKLLTETAAEMLEVPLEKVSLADNKIDIADHSTSSVSYQEIYQYLNSKSWSTKVQGHFYLPKEKDEIKGSGGAPHHIYGYLTHVVLVEVDTLTGETEVLKVVAIPDCGRVMNLQGLEGQTEGGAIMGIGYTLYEDVIIENGVHRTKNLTDYIIPTIQETPIIETIPVENPEPSGPFGAKGIGEVVMIPIIPAITNAIYDAVGVRMKHLPATPERVHQALKEKKLKAVRVRR
ncbi:MULTISPECIES: xanthine dehydrogenase family protein molybdopterin-binding subunit [unclassified Bacillus (in: firmicutes)]|uniref:xanthine dehydrogenase family protein molybdopterin-binding subunit n=1 Tax=unclassified Bacillus (in: firmicutes) TaxID=185979 RepID=UPI0008EA9FAB|nr:MULTISPECIES: molybdopterin cofactor-binding domain-containing protein [unclassified Bacillus (in: firmicutes)]SFB02370.1 xanthine dehydrogenase D subunit [Bacillus sp. UNCCL13]SFQ89105.1 xanthine dehydrogenase D subunit [Bacillus sp. cl95]